MQRRPHVVVELDAIARGEEHLERLVGERLRMARRGEQILERAVAQKSQIVAVLREPLAPLAARSARRDSTS